MQVVTQNHPSAASVTATRNTDAERGVGRAWRHEPDMLPRTKANITMKRRPWGQSAAVEVNKDLTGKPGSVNVMVRAGNSDPSAVGINQNNWGIAGFGDGAAADAQANQIAAQKSNDMLIWGGLAAALAIGFFLVRKS